MDNEFSYIQGGNEIELENLTIGAKLIKIAEKYPDQPAFISHFQDIAFTYSEFVTVCRKLACGLLKMGLKQGDRFGIYSPNNYQWCITQFAASMAGVILVNINPAYQEHELEYCLQKVGCKGLILASHNKKSDYIKFINELAPELRTCQFGELISQKLPMLKYIIRIDDVETAGMSNFSKILASAESAEDIANLDRVMGQISPHDATNIQFTSGTTGYPKGATLSHFNLLNNGKCIGHRLGYSINDRICLPVPLYHCFGMVLGNLAAINYGATIVLPQENFSAANTLEAITKHKCTSLYGVPTMFIEFFKEFEQNHELYKVNTLQKGIMAGALCPQPLMNKLISNWNIHNIQICYGQTECAPVAFQTSQEDSIEDKCTTVGRIFPHTEVKLIDHNGQTVKIGEKGEICIRGFGVMEKYWDDDHATNEAISEDKWIKTGDLGQLDSRGYLQIVGRIKEMIIRGGENIFPKEIEEYLRKIPEISDVQVVGVPDQKLGEETFALVKLREGATLQSKDIYHFCQGKIAHFKIPKYVKFIDSFPQTVTGKYQKFKMVEDLLEEHRLDPLAFDHLKIRHY